MCWSATASVAMVAAGGVATAVALRRGEPKAIWMTIGFFTVMEGLQAAGYAVVDQCGSRANQTITVLSYLHIAIQPLVINIFAMAIAPAPVAPETRRWVVLLAGAASVLLLLRLVPLEAVGPCTPGDILCGPAWCLVSGEWHIGWEVPLNNLPSRLGIPFEFPSYMLAAFLLPLLYGAWRFVALNVLVGPVLAAALTSNPNEMPAIWCLFSIAILLICLSPFIRYQVFGAHRPVPAS